MAEKPVRGWGLSHHRAMVGELRARSGAGRRNPRAVWLALAILGLAFCLQVTHLQTQSLWLDEVITVVRSGLSWPAMISDLMETRNHVPLYFALMHGWQHLGHSEWLVRFPSVIWGVLGVGAVFALAREIGGERVALFSAFLLAISPLYTWYAQDARMYTMLAFLATASALCLLYAWKSNRWQDWLWYALCAGAALLTHFFAAIVLFTQSAFLILQFRQEPARFRNWVLAMIGPGIVYAVWLTPIVTSGGFAPAGPWIAWIPRPSWQDLVWTMYTFVVGATAERHSILTWLPALVIGILLVFLFRQRKALPPQTRWHLDLLAWVIGGTVGITWLISQVRSIYMDRYLLALLPAFLVLVAFGLDRLADRWKGAAVAVLAVLVVFDAVSLYNMYFNSSYYRDDWRGVSEMINEQDRPGDGVISYVNVPFQYYPLEMPVHPISSHTPSEDYFAQATQVVQKQERLWVIIPLTVLNNHSFFDERDALAASWVEGNSFVLWLADRRPLIESRRFLGAQVMLFGAEADSLP